MGFVLEPWISAIPKATAEDEQEEDGLVDNELKVEGAVWNEVGEDSLTGAINWRWQRCC